MERTSEMRAEAKREAVLKNGGHRYRTKEKRNTSTGFAG